MLKNNKPQSAVQPNAFVRGSLNTFGLSANTVQGIIAPKITGR